MEPNAYRMRAERGEVQLGTWITMIRTPAVPMLETRAAFDRLDEIAVVADVAKGA